MKNPVTVCGVVVTEGSGFNAGTISVSRSRSRIADGDAAYACESVTIYRTNVVCLDRYVTGSSLIALARAGKIARPVLHLPACLFDPGENTPASLLQWYLTAIRRYL